MKSFYAHGKLLLTAEYAVLDGALALALPTRLGQSLEVSPVGETLHWKSVDADANCWFEAEFDSESAEIIRTTHEDLASRLKQILNAAKALNRDFTPSGAVVTRLEFSRHWGLGSSSTLITNIAAWASVNPFELLESTFGGSGYDIACALAAGPIWYQRLNGQVVSNPADFHPTFAPHLFFAYLGRKQDSREGIQRYRARNPGLNESWMQEISQISKAMVEAKGLSEFELLLKMHESRIGRALGLMPVQESLFPDFWGVVKSLGAWGGDFVMLTSQRDATATISYLADKGIGTVFSWNELIL
jgi:mevalonate kinase